MSKNASLSKYRIIKYLWHTLRRIMLRHNVPRHTYHTTPRRTCHTVPRHTCWLCHDTPATLCHDTPATLPRHTCHTPATLCHDTPATLPQHTATLCHDTPTTLCHDPPARLCHDTPATLCHDTSPAASLPIPRAADHTNGAANKFSRTKYTKRYCDSWTSNIAVGRRREWADVVVILGQCSVIVGPTWWCCGANVVLM